MQPLTTTSMHGLALPCTPCTYLSPQQCLFRRELWLQPWGEEAHGTLLVLQHRLPSWPHQHRPKCCHAVPLHAPHPLTWGFLGPHCLLATHFCPRCCPFPSHKHLLHPQPSVTAQQRTHRPGAGLGLRWRWANLTSITFKVFSLLVFFTWGQTQILYLLANVPQELW